MGKLKMGRSDDNPTKRHIAKSEIQPIPEPIIIEKIIEVPIDRIIEVEKIVEVPIYVDSEEMQMPDLSKIYETMAEENAKQSVAIKKTREDFKQSIDNLGESSAQGFDRTIRDVEKNRETINNHGALLIALKDANNKKSEQFIKLKKKARIQKYINYVLAVGIILNILL